MDETMWGAAFRRIADLGPVVLHSDVLVDPRAFKHVGHPLAERIAVLAEVLGSRPAPEVGDAVWCRLVVEDLLPALPVPVTLSERAYNPTFAAFVDGLSDNAEALPEVRVEVDAERVARLCLEAAGPGLPPADPSGPVRPIRPSLASGLEGLVGRRVEVTLLGGGEGVYGRVTAAADGLVVLAGDGSARVVPLSSIAYIDVFQLTEEDGIC